VLTGIYCDLAVLSEKRAGDRKTLVARNADTL
jgi:hypothetical protein